MSAASLFLAKNYGQYVISVESELANPHLTSQQKALLYSNIAIAQYGKLCCSLCIHLSVSMLICVWIFMY